MNRNLLTASLALAMAAAAIPVAGYHITGADSATTDPVGGVLVLTSNDFVAGTGLIVCESDGDDDDRLAPLVAGDAQHGQGGLCSTGENAVTGLDGPSSQPAKGDYVKLDMCTILTNDANVGDCETTPKLTGFGWTFEMGVFRCFIPTQTELDAATYATSGDPNFAEVDWAAYYDRLYAWWAYDTDYDDATDNYDQVGDGNYTDASLGMDGAASDVLDSEDANHGHAAAFVDLTASRAAAVAAPVGSAFTDGPATAASWFSQMELAVGAGFHLTDSSWDGLNAGATPNTGGTWFDNGCGSSPVCPPTASVLGTAGDDSVCGPTGTPAPGYGPVFRGPSVEAA